MHCPSLGHKKLKRFTLMLMVTTSNKDVHGAAPILVLESNIELHDMKYSRSSELATARRGQIEEDHPARAQCKKRSARHSSSLFPFSLVSI